MVSGFDGGEWPWICTREQLHADGEVPGLEEDWPRGTDGDDFQEQGSGGALARRDLR